MKKIKAYHWVCVVLLVSGLAFWGCAKKEAEPIKIGGIFDITGATSAVGKDYAQAAKDAERYINENGGVNGRNIQLIANDYAYKIPEAVNLYKQYKDVDKVFVGADTVCANGDVINKIGTMQVALCAKSEGQDFIVATESIKFSAGSVMGGISTIEERDASEVADLPGIEIFNPAFDVTPKEYVNMIITEYGIIPPEAAYHLIKERFGWMLSEGK